MFRLPGVGCSTSWGHMHNQTLANTPERGNGESVCMLYFCQFELGRAER